MARLHGFTKRELVQVYTTMVTARILDEKMLTLLKQGKSFFHIGCSGHEAAQAAAANVLRGGEDWFYPYYRDAALCLGVGMTAREQLLSFLARAGDPNSGGRQMPQHYGHKKLRIVSQSSPTGTQYLQAVGTALRNKWEATKEVVYVSSGEGSTSQGDFHEALNWASREKLPVIFHIQDNGYAISVPIAEQTAGKSVYALVAGYQNLARFDVNGVDFFETQLAFKTAVERARRGKGPAVIVSHVVRLLPHSSSDDQRKYREKKDLEKEMLRDPLVKFERDCQAAKLFTKKEFEAIGSECRDLVNQAAEWADAQDHPKAATALDHLFGENPIATETPLNPMADKIVVVDAVNHALKEELARNSKMVIYGQDVADPKGGVFTATKGLSTEFGKQRVFNSALAESSIIGTAIGLAVAGYKPVVEIQFGDYIWTAMMQLRNEMATMRYRSNNHWTCPMVVRVPVGGYIHGGLCHSQSIDGYFTHLPGVYIAYPSNSADAKGLLKAACRMNDPVIFMEHKGLYRQGYAATPEPDETYVLPFGQARIVQPGADLTIVCWGALVQKSLEAVNRLKLEEVSVEIIDLRTLAPLDMATVADSIGKTGKVLIVHEDNLTGGPGAEIAARIASECFEMLDAPVRRVGARDCPIPYNWYLEEQILPQVSDIQQAISEILEY